MRKENTAPTIAQDIRALADLYATLAVIAWRRVLKKSPAPQPQFYGPFEIIRPRESVRADN